MEKKASASTNSLSRRQFLYYSAIAAAAATAGGVRAADKPRKLSGGDKLRIAAVGAGGKGSSDIQCCSSEEIVAVCDADENMATGARKQHPNAKFYGDWRQMLDKEHKNIDAVLVSTPDHLHALVASAAISMNKHVYCQKPLTQTVYEARYLRDLAKKHKVVTQMGNQGSSEDGLRRAVEVVQAGVIGPVKQIHVWTNRPIWPQGVTRPPGEDKVPENFKWDSWLGPAPYRPFKASWPEDSAASETTRTRRGKGAVYHPFAWRGWYEFGTGALGDMACHTANLPFRAAKLGYPRLVELLDHSELNPDTYPKTAKIRFVFPARDGLPETEFFWYDGNPKDPSVKPLRPAEELTKPIKDLQDSVPDSGCMLIGEKGVLFSPDDYGARFLVKMNDEKELVDGKNHDAVKAIPQSIPRNPHEGNADLKQHLEWIARCKDSSAPTPYSDFAVAAYLTEIILLGCVALRVGKKLEWDGPAMKAMNTPEAAHFVKRTYRKGWNLA
jgi:hypothetical protein